MASERDVFNIREAAAFLGAHEQTVRKLARRGAIPAFKVGKDWRFRREALLAWSEKPPPPAPAAPRVARCSVLVVDDDQNVCRASRRVLERMGCTARTATDGRLALELVREQSPDLILLDLKMPDMTGPAFLAELRATHPALPVVIVTGYPDSALMTEAAAHAPVMLLTKPVEPELLERTVRSVVGRKLVSGVWGVAREAPSEVPSQVVANGGNR